MMFVTFKITGEYVDYVGMELTESELKSVQKFIDEVNNSVSNISIQEWKVEK